MTTARLPLVGDMTLLGEAARVATEAKVGAVVVASTNGLWILPIKMLPDQKVGIVGGFVSSLARRLEAPGNVAQSDFTLNSIDDGLAEIDFDINHPWRINVVYGFKECDADRRHTYPPTYTGTSCIPPCSGSLVAKP